jgi:hypothetical protein
MSQYAYNIGSVRAFSQADSDDVGYFFVVAAGAGGCGGE